MSMDAKLVAAGTFKQKCLALLDQVEMTRVPIVVTKRGRPVAKIVPIDDGPNRSTKGSVTILTDDEERLFSTGEWPDPFRSK